MIYSTELDKFPNEEKSKEINSYKDENGMVWKIALVDNGFFVAYYGIPYFKETYFHFEIEDKPVFIKNTGCFFIQSIDFDIFCDFRDILKNENTDDIWDSIGEFIAERLENDNGLMACEIVE